MKPSTAKMMKPARKLVPELIRANSRLSLWPEKVRGESNYITVLVPLRVKGKDVASLYMYIYNMSSVQERLDRNILSGEK